MKAEDNIDGEKVRKAAAVFLAAVLCCLSLAGCGFRYAIDNDNYAQDEFKLILQALDQRDKQAFKNLFSKESLEKIDGIDRKIDEFFEFYQGVSVSSKDLGGSSEKQMGRDRYLTFDQPYAVVTDQEAYRIVFSYTAYDEVDEDHVGLHSILIMTQALADEAKFWQWPDENSIEVLYTIDDCET